MSSCRRRCVCACAFVRSCARVRAFFPQLIPSLCRLLRRSNAMVKLECSGCDTLRSSTRSGTLTPEFEETFLFPTRDRNTVVSIIVEHVASGWTSNKLLGRVDVVAADFRGQGEEKVRAAASFALRGACSVSTASSITSASAVVWSQSAVVWSWCALVSLVYGAVATVAGQVPHG